MNIYALHAVKHWRWGFLLPFTCESRERGRIGGKMFYFCKKNKVIQPNVLFILWSKTFSLWPGSDSALNKWETVLDICFINKYLIFLDADILKKN